MLFVHRQSHVLTGYRSPGLNLFLSVGSATIAMALETSRQIRGPQILSRFSLARNLRNDRIMRLFPMNLIGTKPHTSLHRGQSVSTNDAHICILFVNGALCSPLIKKQKKNCLLALPCSPGARVSFWFLLSCTARALVVALRTRSR